MPGSWPPHELPNLTNENHEVTSPASRKYNCIAWAAGDDTRKWWPDPFGIGHWPRNAQRRVTTQAFIDAYSDLGYVVCQNAVLEHGIEKIAIYATDGLSGPEPTHASLQLEDGRWSSKLGDYEDIAHRSLDGVACLRYGRAVVYMSRARN